MSENNSNDESRTECFYCGNVIEGGDYSYERGTKIFNSKTIAIPFKCRRCGELFCKDHRLPEKHECTGKKVTVVSDDQSISIEDSHPEIEVDGFTGSRNRSTKQVIYASDFNKKSSLSKYIVGLLLIIVALYAILNLF
ncbi:AN1-type zinc finger domain-containing protein [Methanococcoides sp. AM1]|uniref:AN1-type zinc finger domain-containing protein n=1 Tax=Methanococcoides sp. AM1 TaxID=1201011 RepID=UPI001083800E|nr:AN1-type zinc finger domain-containing protein [Methanococcoides sp. AM1]